MVKWTYDACKIEALKYTARNKFMKHSGSAYNACIKNGWLEEVCKHMIIYSKPNNYWTYDACKIEALKYESKNEFRKHSSSAYQTARRKKFLNEICSHMQPMGNQCRKIIYSYEFSNNYAYVGMTYNIIKRNWEHLTDIKSPIYKHMLKYKLIPIKKILTKESVDIFEAKRLEEFWFLFYKDSGWVLLNKAKTGALGGNKIYWDFERCKEEALKFNTKKDFQYKSGSAYNAALKNNWINEITKHMIILQRPKGYWTLEKCMDIAKDCKTKTDFILKSCAAHAAAKKYGWYESVCEHMVRKKN